MFKMGGMSSYTKTGRKIALGRAVGRSLARGGGEGGSSRSYPKYNVLVTETKIEILDGIHMNENGEWMKETLVKLVPEDHPDNIYTGSPEIWVDKNRLNIFYFEEDVKRAIDSALPVYLYGDITIRDGKIIIKKNCDFLIFMIVIVLFAMYFTYF
jgi:hypothetical protein